MLRIFGQQARTVKYTSHKYLELCLMKSLVETEHARETMKFLVIQAMKGAVLWVWGHCDRSCRDHRDR